MICSTADSGVYERQITKGVTYCLVLQDVNSEMVGVGKVWRTNSNVTSYLDQRKEIECIYSCKSKKRMVNGEKIIVLEKIEVESYR